MGGMSNPAAPGTESQASASVPPGIRALADHWGLVLTYGLITLGLGIVLLAITLAINAAAFAASRIGLARAGAA